MKKIPKFAILNFIFWAILLLLNLFYLKPILKSKYLNSDVLAFKSISWKYSIMIFLIVSIVLVIYGYKINKEKMKILNTTLIILSSIFISYLLKNFTDDFILYIDTKTDSKDIVVVYKVLENKQNKVFELYDNKDFITFGDELDKINNYRIKNKNKSVFDYKNGDTIQVKFNRGIIGVNYIK